MNGEITNEVLHLLLSSTAARMKDAEERLGQVEGTVYALEIRLTALEAIARGEDENSD
jgi:hypothetical protein